MGTPQKIFTTTLWAVVVLGMLLLVALSTAKRSSPPALVFSTVGADLPTLFDLPQFKLVNQDGNDVTDGQLKGRPFISAFVFTQCAGPCPMMFAKLKALQKTLPNPDIHLVTFTVDPANDTPAVLKQKAKELEADESRWSFLTGDKDSVYKLMRDMLQPTPKFKDSPLMHDEHFYLFDADGKCRGRYFSKDDADMTKLATDAQMLAEEEAAVTVHDLPAINAVLNGTSSLLLLTAYICIKLRKVHAHAYMIIAALVTSSAFLACYLVYHYFVGATYVDQRFPQVPHSLRTIYKWILFPHLMLAIFMLPLIGRSLYLAYHRQWDKHRRISPWSFWIWLYVSVTGVIIYWMLYHLFPGMQQAAVAGVIQ